MEKANKLKRAILTIVLSLVSIAWIFPVLLVVINSFKKKTSISLKPFALPTGKSFVGVENYIKGIEKIEFFKYFGYSLFITVGSVALILLSEFTSPGVKSGATVTVPGFDCNSTGLKSLS